MVLFRCELGRLSSPGVEAANAVQPSYSHVLKPHVLFTAPGDLPLTVKGTVQRSKAEQIFHKDLMAVKRCTFLALYNYYG